MTIELSSARLKYLIDIIPELLSAIAETDFSHQPVPDKWSKKQILGHLIDSATCNHQRFVRSQFELIPKITYDQHNWNKYSYYNQLDSSQLILFWTTYIKQLLALMENISPDNLQCRCDTGGAEPHTITCLYQDYVIHLEHHLKQILFYPESGQH